MDPKAGLEEVGMRTFLPYRDLNSDPLVIRPAASRYIDYAIPAPVSIFKQIINKISDWNECLV
jgi:hypothetical protein